MLGLSRLAIVLDTENDTESLKALQDAIPQMVAVLKGAVDAGDEDRTTQSFEVSRTCGGVNLDMAIELISLTGLSNSTWMRLISTQQAFWRPRPIYEQPRRPKNPG